MTSIPKTHPRYHSLMLRHHISQGMKNGVVHETGLIAHGRGEAFDYLLGEETSLFADEACKIAAGLLLQARDPVISVNGNVAALSAKECVQLEKIIPAKIEINLFHRSIPRINKVFEVLINAGAKSVYGLKGDAQISGLNHDRGICDRKGIYSSDTVLVPLEDGDRCEALKKMGKTVITIDLNPLSRTARTADVTIVDNVIRALPKIIVYIHNLKALSKNELGNFEKNWDNKKNLSNTIQYIANRLASIYQSSREKN